MFNPNGKLIDTHNRITENNQKGKGISSKFDTDNDQ